MEKEGTHTLLSQVGHTRDQYSVGKADMVTEGKERQEENHTIFVTNNDADKAEAITDPKNRGRWLIKFMNKMKNTEFSCPRRRNEFWETVCSINTYLSMLNDCVVEIVNKSEDENYLQDNFCFERTRSDTPKYLGSLRLRRLVQWNSDPNYIRESQLVDRGIARTRRTCRRITQGQQYE